MAQVNIVVQVDDKRVDISSSNFPDSVAMKILRNVTSRVLEDPSLDSDPAE